MNLESVYSYISQRKTQSMIQFTTLSIKSKVGLGILLSYTSFEVYMQLRTRYLVYSRQQKFSKLMKDISEDDDEAIEKYKSATISGMFINPFEEYRPQTGFEFLFVRLMEAVESIYGNKIELHDKYPSPSGEFKEVGDLLKSHKPNLEIMKENAVIFQECLSKNNFKKLFSSSGWFKSLTSNIPAVNNQMLFTWLGQSCSLIQISGINFLTDPIISDHLISHHFGPRRLIKSPLSLEDINHATNNKLNFVMVSHDHPDHLEMDFAKKIGNSATWIVPLGMKTKLARKGIFNIIEMDWWDTVPLNQFITLQNPESKLPDKYEVVCLPTMHWSGRYILDSNQSLWASFIIKRNGKSILYHAGDTGYCEELFNLIGKKHGPVKLSLLPIGQYCPSWHQKPRHISPEESIKIVNNLSSKFMMGVHWGTFKLSSEPILEPKNLLLDLTSKLNKSNFYKVPEFGLTYLYDLDKDTEIQFHQ